MKTLAALGIFFCLLSLSTPAEARRHHRHAHAHHHRHIPERHRDKPSVPIDVRRDLASRVAIASDTVELSLQPQQGRSVFEEGTREVRFVEVRPAYSWELQTIEYVSPFDDFELPVLGLGVLFTGCLCILIGVAHIPSSTIVTGVERWRGRWRKLSFKVWFLHRDLRYRLSQLR